MMHSSAAVSALIVSNPSDGGESMQHEIVSRRDGRERLTQARFPRQRGDELHVGAGEVNRCGNAVEVLDFGPQDDVLERNFLQQGVIDVVRQPRFVDAEAGRGIALRIGVDDEHAAACDRRVRRRDSPQSCFFRRRLFD